MEDLKELVHEVEKEQLAFDCDLNLPLTRIALNHLTSLPERAIKPRILERLDMRESRIYFFSSECTTFRGIFLHFPRHNNTSV